MEDKQFTTDDLQDHSPHSSQAFQADRFFKKTYTLNIPDTIPENCSAELSGNSLKMEAPIGITETSSEEDKENIASSQPKISNESLNTSTIITIDNSYIKQCERNLLDNSNTEDDKCVVNRSLVDNKLLGVNRMSAYPDDTISTPPSALRKEISLLRNEMAEVHEFHDFEIQLLKEEKLHNEADSYNYSEIISKMREKYSALMELYVNLKSEYEEYRADQEQIQSKTADYLESLRSQIEASDNSLNFSNASFVSFNAGIRSSTMVEDNTEVEATILHDATILAKDPLSITNDGMFKTPMQTPLKSAKKLFSEKSTGNSVEKETITNGDTIDSEYRMQLLNVETALYDKIKEVEDLEKRLFKVEDLSSVLQNELERVTMQNNTLKESLSRKTEQLNELSEKLFTETISLNPALRDSLLDIPETKLLLVFIETIMESCRKIQAEEVTKHNKEKSEWELRNKSDAITIETLQSRLSSILIEVENLKKQLSSAENTISTRDEEILMLQSHVSSFRQTRDDFASTRETLLALESKLTLTEAEKAAVENRYRELENLVDVLKREIETNRNKHSEENLRMKKELELQEILKSELFTVKENLTSAEEAVAKLQSRLEFIESEKSELENRCAELQKGRDEIKHELESMKSEKLKFENSCIEFENIRIENETLKNEILECRKTSEELKLQLEDFETEKILLKNSCTALESIRLENDSLKEQIFETEKALKEQQSQLELLESEKIEFSVVRIENENLKRQIFETEKISHELKGQIVNLESENQQLENRCTELENIRLENKNLEDQIFEMKKGSEELKSKLNLVESEKLQLENRCTELESFRLVSEKISMDLQNKLKSLESENCAFVNRSTEFECIRIENDNLKLQIFEIQSQLESMESEKLELENHYQTFDNIQIENKDLKQKVFETEKALEDFKSQLKSLESEKIELENQCSELENIRTENDNLKHRVFELEKVSEELKSQLESLESDKAELESRCDDLENFQRENDNLKHQISELERTYEELKSAKECLESEKEQLENRCAELGNIGKQNKHLEDRVFENERILEELKSQLESLESEKRELENRYTHLEKVLDEKERVFESKKLELENRCETFENIQNENKDLREKIFDVEKTSEELKSQLESLESEKFKLEDRCKDFENIQMENDNLQQRIFELEKVSADLQNQLEIVKCEKFDLENQFAELEKIRIQNEKTSGELENRYLELQKLLTENESLKQQNLESEKLELEKRCEMYEEVKFENANLKQRIFDTEKMLNGLKIELEIKKDDEVRNANKVGELLLEVDQLRKQSADVADAVEETQKKISSLLSDWDEFDPELPSERITKVIENSQFRETKIVSVFIETIKKTCTGVENELLKNFDSKKQQWETEKDKLKEEITESKAENENLLKFQASQEREVKTLQEQQQELVDNLTTAKDTILLLKSQIKSFEVEKSRQVEEENRNYEKIQTENDDLKERIFHSEKMLTELQDELQNAKRDQKKNITKVEELIREIEELKRENDGFSHAVEETRNLADVLSENPNDSDLPGDRITKLIAKTSNGETKIVSDFVETITKTCKGVQNEMIRKFDCKKLEWETQKGIDIQILQEQIQNLTEKNEQLERVVCQAKNELAMAEEMITELQSQVMTAKIEKEQVVESLKIDIDTKETIIKGLDEMKNQRENENSCLKKQLQERQDLVFDLKNRLVKLEEELDIKETKMQELLKENDSLKKEMEFISGKLEKVEKSNRSLLEVLSDVQILLNIPDDCLMDSNNKKILSEKINDYVKTQLEELKSENTNLKIRNENLKEEIKQLTQLIGETELKNANVSHPNNKVKMGKNIDLCVRRLDKLEEINHNMTELLTKVLTLTEFGGLEKLKLCSVREYPNVMKKVVAHINNLLKKMKEMKEENGQLDEECETYSNIIKDLKKEAAAVWKENKEKVEAFEAEIDRLKEEKKWLEKEKEDLEGKISKFSEENARLKSKSEGIFHTCVCGNESKKINELKRAILVKEQKLLELQDLEAQTNSFKSQIEYLKTALDREKKKMGEEKEKNKKLQSELNEMVKNQKTENKKTEENQVLDELRMRGSISGGIVQEFVDKEKMRKLSKDIGILKELCRARYAEIKRLEAVNAALRNGTPKNSNQMDSPIRSRGYNTRSKNQIREFWKTEIIGKENSAL